MRSTSAIDAPVFLLVVDADGGVVVGQQVAQQLGDEALLLEQHRRRPPRLHLLPDLGPDLMEVGQVADDVFLRAAAGGGADDDAAGEAVLLAELADDAAQAARAPRATRSCATRRRDRPSA